MFFGGNQFPPGNSRVVSVGSRHAMLCFLVRHFKAHFNRKGHQFKAPTSTHISWVFFTSHIWILDMEWYEWLGSVGIGGGVGWFWNRILFWLCVVFLGWWLYISYRYRFSNMYLYTIYRYYIVYVYKRSAWLLKIFHFHSDSPRWTFQLLKRP